MSWRLKVKNQAIYGQYYGRSKLNKKIILFMDEETGQIKKIHSNKLQIVAEK